MRAKICGLTRPSDAALAVEHGADWLGVIFAGGPRHLSASHAREVVLAASAVPVVGVFAAVTADEVLAMRDATGIEAAQLHAGASASVVRQLRREGLTVWAVRRPGALADLAALEDEEALAADAVLVEARVPGALGGTGHALSDELGVEARRRLQGRCMVLAGGLGPETIGARMTLVRPDIVDVSSGVEIAPGRKDPVRLIRFLEVVRGSATRA